MKAQGLGDVVAAGAHVGGAPDRLSASERRRRAVILEVAEQQVVGGLLAQLPGGGGGHGAVVDGVEIAAGGQDVEAAARRARRRGRAQRTCRRGRRAGALDLVGAGGARGGGVMVVVMVSQHGARWPGRSASGARPSTSPAARSSSCSTTSPMVRRGRPVHRLRLVPLPRWRGGARSGPVRIAPRSAVSGSKPSFRSSARARMSEASPGAVAARDAGEGDERGRVRGGRWATGRRCGGRRGSALP